MRVLKFLLMIIVVISIIVGSIIYALSAIIRSIAFLFWFDTSGSKKEIANILKKQMRWINQ